MLISEVFVVSLLYLSCNNNAQKGPDTVQWKAEFWAFANKAYKFGKGG